MCRVFLWRLSCDSLFCCILGSAASLSSWFLFERFDEALRLGWPNFIFIMGPGHSFPLRIGSDSSVVADSGRTGGVSDRSAGVELRDAPVAPPLPLDKGKGKVDLIKYPGGSEYLRSVVQYALTVGPSKVSPSYGATFARRYRPPFGVRVWSPDVLTLYVVSVPKMVCFFEVAFDNALHFPLHPFIKGVLHHFNVCHSQLAPNG